MRNKYQRKDRKSNHKFEVVGGQELLVRESSQRLMFQPEKCFLIGTGSLHGLAHTNAQWGEHPSFLLPIRRGRKTDTPALGCDLAPYDKWKQIRYGNPILRKRAGTENS